MIKKYAIVALLFLNFFGCKEEEGIQVSFDKETIGLSSSETAYPHNLDGIALILNEPAPEAFVVFIEISGDAEFGVDYIFDNPVLIPKGDSRVSINLQFFDDFLDELDEVVNLRIESVDNKAIEIGELNSNYFTIRDDDHSDLIISLGWPSGPDMDIYLWKESFPGSNAFEFVRKSNFSQPGGLAYENILLEGLEEDGLYGLSFVYRSGNGDRLDFRVGFTPTGEATVEGNTAELVYYPSYTESNINNGDVVIREQFFTKEGFEFKNFTTITIPESGS